MEARLLICKPPVCLLTHTPDQLLTHWGMSTPSWLKPLHCEAHGQCGRAEKVEQDSDQRSSFSAMFDVEKYFTSVTVYFMKNFMKEGKRKRVQRISLHVYLPQSIVRCIIHPQTSSSSVSSLAVISIINSSRREFKATCLPDLLVTWPWYTVFSHGVASPWTVEQMNGWMSISQNTSEDWMCLGMSGGASVKWVRSLHTIVALLWES